MLTLTLIQKIAVWLVPVLFAITMHEAAHGLVARQFGDPTAQMLGRLSLNPLRHIDPIGTILVPALFLLLPGNILFGWAKPVPITVQNFRNPRRDMAFVAAAGPMSNLLMGVFWALVVRMGALLSGSMPHVAIPVMLTGMAGIFINAVLMVLNLLPLPPLDGGRVVSGLLPRNLARGYDRIEPYGLIILVGLLITGLLGHLLWPFVSLTVVGLMHLTGLPMDKASSLLTLLFPG